MTRPARSPAAAGGKGATARIRKAGIALFKELGYHGASVRTLAERVGMEAASLYHHFPSKQELLFDIFEQTMDDLLDGLQRALDGGSFEDRLRAAVRFHVLFHIERRDEAFISHSELRSLTPANRRRINAKRDRYERTLRAFLDHGVTAGAFAIRDVPITTIAVLTMCSGVSDWFADRGRLGAEALADQYAEIVLGLIRPAGARKPSARRKQHRAARTARAKAKSAVAVPRSAGR